MNGFKLKWQFAPLVSFSAVIVFLTACVEREEVLPGERLDIRDETPLTEEELASIQELDPRPRKQTYKELRQKKQEAIAEAKEPVGTLNSASEVTRVSLPSQVNLANWTHKNGSASHNAPHSVLRQNLNRIWSVNIGAGNGRQNRISADPIVAEGRIFALDSAARVTAVSTSGQVLWARDLTPATEKQGSISGGGLAYGGGRLLVTTGFGEVIALQPATGKEFWRHKLDGGISSAPSVTGDTVVAVARNNQAVGLSLSDGRIKWQQQSSTNAPGLFGAGAPASTGRIVIVPFSSGEVIGAVPSNGARAWSTAVSGGGKGLARSLVADISGDPVIAGTRVYVGNQSGRLVAIDRRSGERLWTTNVGAYTPVLPVGNDLFVVSDDSHLIRLNAEDGAEIWSVRLPRYKRPKKRRDVFANFGPLLAGGRIIVASSDGGIYSFNPSTGQLLSQTKMSSGAASQPAIASGRMYVISENGQLHAFQ